MYLLLRYFFFAKASMFTLKPTLDTSKVKLGKVNKEVLITIGTDFYYSNNISFTLFIHSGFDSFYDEIEIPVDEY